MIGNVNTDSMTLGIQAQEWVRAVMARRWFDSLWACIAVLILVSGCRSSRSVTTESGLSTGLALAVCVDRVAATYTVTVTNHATQSMQVLDVFAYGESWAPYGARIQFSRRAMEHLKPHPIMSDGQWSSLFLSSNVFAEVHMR